MTYNRHRRGVVSVLAALLFAIMGGMAAFAIDVGHILYARSKLVSAAESGALGAVEQLPDPANAIAEAKHLSRLNYRDGEGGDVVVDSDVEFGTWNRDTLEFTVTDVTLANAVRVTARLSEQTGNPLPLFLGRLLGRDQANVSATAIASRQLFQDGYSAPGHQPTVYVTSTKALSNVVLEFADGSHQKFEDFNEQVVGNAAAFYGTGEHAGKEIVGVWIKSGQNDSGDGPGYGERVDNNYEGTMVHGTNVALGPIPHVTATFDVLLLVE